MKTSPTFIINKISRNFSFNASPLHDTLVRGGKFMEKKVRVLGSLHVFLALELGKLALFVAGVMGLRGIRMHHELRLRN